MLCRTSSDPCRAEHTQFFDYSLLKSVVNSFSFENMSQASRSGRTSPSPPRSAGGTALASLRDRVASRSRGASAVAGESPLSASSIAGSYERLSRGAFSQNLLS